MYGLKQAAVLAYNNLVKIFLLVVMYLANNLQAYGDMQQIKQKFSFALTTLVSNIFLVPKLLISWTLFKILQNLHGTWKGELLWIDHWLELQQVICSHLHTNLHNQIPQTFSPPCTKKSILCTTQIDSSRICPKHSV